jgi:hypothetical protein
MMSAIYHLKMWQIILALGLDSLRSNRLSISIRPSENNEKPAIIQRMRLDDLGLALLDIG